MLAAARRRYEVAAMFVKDSRRREEERSAIAAAGGSHDKREYVRAMFSNIAPSYDRLNHILSFSIDRVWRRRAIAAMEWRDAPGGRFLDLCAGTLDVASQLSLQEDFDGTVVGIDFAEAMLREGKGKGRADRIHPLVADALALPVSDDSCDGAIAAFGMRNLADLGAGLSEVRRVLRPGARFVILEFTTPRRRLVRAAYHAYFHHLLPFIGGVVSGNRAAYRYLPESVASFPAPRRMAAMMRRAGYRDVRWRPLTFGIAAIYVGSKG